MWKVNHRSHPVGARTMPEFSFRDFLCPSSRAMWSGTGPCTAGDGLQPSCVPLQAGNLKECTGRQAGDHQVDLKSLLGPKKTYHPARRSMGQYDRTGHVPSPTLHPSITTRPGLHAPSPSPSPPCPVPPDPSPTPHRAPPAETRISLILRDLLAG